MVVSSFADFLNLEDVSLATGAGTLTKKTSLPDLKIDHSQKIHLIIAKIIVNGNLILTLERNSIKTLILRQNYSFDNGNNSDKVYENYFLG